MDKMRRLIKYLLAFPCLIFLIFSAYLSFEYFALGPFSYLRTSDNLDSLIPRAIENWTSGNSYWQPAATGGIDRLANAVNSFDPTVLIFSVFPIWMASGLIIFLATLIGQCYSFFLCRKIMKFGVGPSLIAGLLFGYSLAFNDVFGNILGMAIFPAVLYYLEKIFYISNWSWLKKMLFGLGLGIIFASCSSLLLILPFSLVLIAFWFLFIRHKSVKQLIIPFVCLLVPGVLVHAQEFLSLMANAKFSQRSGNENYFHAGISQYIFWTKALFMNNLPAVIVSFAGIFIIKKDKRIFYWLLSLLFFLVFVVSWYQPFASNFGQYLGFFKNFDFSRFYLSLPFFASLTAAFVLDQLRGSLVLENPKDAGVSRTFPVRRIVLVLILLGLFVSTLELKFGHLKYWVASGNCKAYTQSPDITYIKRITVNDPLFRAGIVNSQTTDIKPTLVQLQKIESINSYANITSKNMLDFYKLLVKDSSLKNITPFSAPENSSTKFNSFTVNENLLSLANVRFLFSVVPLDLPGFVLVPTPSSANFPDWGKVSGSAKLKLRINENFTGRKFLVYNNKNVLPRFFLASSSKIFETEDELLLELGTTDLKTLQQTVFLQKDEVADINFDSFPGKQGSIKVEKYSDDEIRLNVVASGPMILVASNVYSPFWKAYVNGKPEKIVHADHAFWGLILKDKNSEVIFKYEPPYSQKK